MGCNCCKQAAVEDGKESPKERFSSKSSTDGRASRRENAYGAKDKYDRSEGRAMLIDKHANGSVRQRGENLERKREKMELTVVQHPAVGAILKAAEGEQVAAGWPAWLAAVAGEAVNGWVPRRADSFEKLDKVFSSPLHIQCKFDFVMFHFLYDPLRILSWISSMHFSRGLVPIRVSTYLSDKI